MLCVRNHPPNKTYQNIFSRNFMPEEWHNIFEVSKEKLAATQQLSFRIEGAQSFQTSKSQEFLTTQTILIKKCQRDFLSAGKKNMKVQVANLSDKSKCMVQVVN